MLPKERVYKALDLKEPDRIPWGEHSIDYNVYEDILGRPSFVQGKMKETIAIWEGRRDEVVESYKRDRLDLVRALEMDIVNVHVTYEKNYRGDKMEKIDDETYRDEKGDIWRISATTHCLMPYKYNPEAYKIPTIEELEKEIDYWNKKPLDDPNDPKWELVQHAVKEMGKTHFIMVMWGDLEFPRFGMPGEEGWMNMILYPEITKKFAERVGAEILWQVRTVAQLGIDGIMPCGDLGSSTGLMASPELYREVVYPVHKAYVEEAHKHGLKVLKHCCGHIWPVIDEIAELYDAYEAIQASAGMDIKKLKERVGDKICLWGGIMHENIIMGTPEDIRNDARYAFTYAAPGGGFIMGSTHSLAVDAKVENILEMKKCRDKWGTYPIDPKKFK